MGVRFGATTALILGNILATTTGGLAEDANSFYAGYQGGIAWGGDDRVGLKPTGDFAGQLSQNGALAGVVVGHSWRRKAVVTSLEAELTASSIGDRSVQGGYRSSTRMDLGAGLRLRLGAQAKTYLPYVAAGLAIGWFDYQVSGGGADIAEKFSSPGFSLAAGWEHPLNSGWSYRVEYRYTEYRGVTLENAGFSTKATPLDKSLRLGFVHDF